MAGLQTGVCSDEALATYHRALAYVLAIPTAQNRRLLRLWNRRL